MKIQLPEKFEAMFRPKRVKVFYGGRGGAKTESFAAVAAIQAIQQNKKFLCLREFMNSISESVHATLETVIDRNNMGHLFDIQRTAIINKMTAETSFSYGQLSRNLQSIKSKQGIDVAWIEEGETISQKSLDILIPTLRKEGSELWISFNPEDEFGAVYSTYVEPHKDAIARDGFYEDDYLYVCKVNLTDNPFATQELILESQKCKERDIREWEHIWGGEPIRDYSDSLIKPEWVRSAVDAHIKLGWKPAGFKSLGFDPADAGKDQKAIAGRTGSLVTILDAWGDHDLSDAITRAFTTYTEYGSDFLVYDSIGVGSAVKVAADRDDPLKKMKLHAFNGSGKVENPEDKWRDRPNKDTFKNRRAQGWWALAERFENTYNAIEKGIYTDPEKQISLSSNLDLLDSLRAELSAVQRVRRAGLSLLQVESKEEMIKRGVRSPNMADALVYCFSNPAPDEMVTYVPRARQAWG